MTSVRLRHAGRQQSTLDVSVRMDRGDVHLRLPAAVAMQLGLKFVDWRWWGDRKVRYVGPVELEALGRVTICGAIVTGDAVVLSTIALDSLDLGVDPAHGTLFANHAVPQSIAVDVGSPS